MILFLYQWRKDLSYYLQWATMVLIGRWVILSSAFAVQIGLCSTVQLGQIHIDEYMRELTLTITKIYGNEVNGTCGQNETSVWHGSTRGGTRVQRLKALITEARIINNLSGIQPFYLFWFKSGIYICTKYCWIAFLCNCYIYMVDIPTLSLNDFIV